MNKLDPSTETTSNTNRRSVSEGNTNGFRRGLLALLGASTVTGLSSLCSRSQTACQGVSQESSLVWGELQLATFLQGEFPNLPDLLPRQRTWHLLSFCL